VTICDTCREPGYCCKRLMLGGVTEKAYPTKLEALAIAARWPFEPMGLPFLPVTVLDGYWLFTCPKLDWDTGRCTDYENRPTLCRTYEPKSDPLCIEYERPACT
jgi:Fe-S-cluster containining protein